MKRSFEENVPKVRPRVRLGHAFDEQVAEAEQMAEAQQVAAAEVAESGIAPDPASQLPLAPIAAVTEPLAQPVQTVKVESAPAKRAARRTMAPTIAEVTGLAHALTTDLAKAAEFNARLKSDLDAALTALRTAADESRDQRADCVRLVADLESRAAAIRALRGDLDLLEAERDGALAQVARLTRELREEKSRSAASHCCARYCTKPASYRSIIAATAGAGAPSASSWSARNRPSRPTALVIISSRLR